MNYRAAEIKHARLAMLAAAGWPIAELYGGGLGLVSPVYWAAVVIAAAGVEFVGFQNKDLPGDYGFDPLGLYPKDPEERSKMQDQELTHGRTAMVAIVAFAAQEFTSKIPVVKEWPFFFEPIWTFLFRDLGTMDLSRGYYNY